MTLPFDRDLLRGSIDLMVLSVLAEGPTYGYQIQKRLLAASGDRLRVQAGTLYPILHRLEAEGQVQATWDDSSGRRRRFYTLTGGGRSQLDRRASQWRQYADCMANLLGPAARVSPAAG